MAVSSEETRKALLKKLNQIRTHLNDPHPDRAYWYGEYETMIVSILRNHEGDGLQEMIIGISRLEPWKSAVEILLRARDHQAEYNVTPSGQVEFVLSRPAFHKPVPTNESYEPDETNGEYGPEYFLCLERILKGEVVIPVNWRNKDDEVYDQGRRLQFLLSLYREVA